MFGRQSALGARKSMGDDMKAASQPARHDNDAVPESTVERNDTHTFTGEQRWPITQWQRHGHLQPMCCIMQTAPLRVAEQEACVGFQQLVVVEGQGSCSMSQRLPAEALQHAMGRRLPWLSCSMSTG